MTDAPDRNACDAKDQTSAASELEAEAIENFEWGRNPVTTLGFKIASNISGTALRHDNLQSSGREKGNDNT